MIKFQKGSSNPSAEIKLVRSCGGLSLMFCFGSKWIAECHIQCTQSTLSWYFWVLSFMSNSRYMPEYVRWLLRHLNTALRILSLWSGAVPKMQNLKVWQWWYKLRLTYSESKTRQQLHWLSIFRLLSLVPYPSKQSDFQLAVYRGWNQTMLKRYILSVTRRYRSDVCNRVTNWVLR